MIQSWAIASHDVVEYEPNVTQFMDDEPDGETGNTNCVDMCGVDATGRKQEFGLGRVLPGQRDGALLWYRDITRLLKGKLDMEEMAACPCLLRARKGQALVLLHVDDLLLVGEYIELQLLSVLKEKYKV